MTQRRPGDEPEPKGPSDDEPKPDDDDEPAGPKPPA
jgi:hypothetical protein